MSLKRNVPLSVIAAIPVMLFAFSTGPVGMRTGAPADGGLDCTACHRTFAPANSDTRGSFVIATGRYTPGLTQTVAVRLRHPEALRWGFQLTARLASDPTKQAGTFTTNDFIRVRCSNNQDGPCNGGIEFAEHRSAPFTSAGAGFTFFVDWTPPDTDLGDVIFYSAGNAANGDGTLNGDRIYTSSLKIESEQGCTSTTLPVITAVGNAASYDRRIGPNTMITIFGSGFQRGATSRTAEATDLNNHTFPRELSCVAVEMGGKRLPLTFVSATQINAQAPADLGAGQTPVVVIANPDRANQINGLPVMAQMQSFAPAFFMYSKSAIAANVANSATPIGDPSAVKDAVFAKPGDMVTLWATGLGPTDPSLPEGAMATGATPCTGTLTLTIGGIAVPAADVTYVGLSPKSISGIYQINARIPDSLPDGNATVVAQVGGMSTQPGGTIALKR